jgi:hypothetical protein
MYAISCVYNHAAEVNWYFTLSLRRIDDAFGSVIHEIVTQRICTAYTSLDWCDLHTHICNPCSDLTTYAMFNINLESPLYTNRNNIESMKILHMINSYSYASQSLHSQRSIIYRYLGPMFGRKIVLDLIEYWILRRFNRYDYGVIIRFLKLGFTTFANIRTQLRRFKHKLYITELGFYNLD